MGETLGGNYDHSPEAYEILGFDTDGDPTDCLDDEATAAPSKEPYITTIEMTGDRPIECNASSCTRQLGWDKTRGEFYLRGFCAKP